MSRKRILLVEDDRVVRKAAETGLRGLGYEVVAALDGEEGVRRARSDAPDLILLDLLVPKVGGFDVLRALRADPATSGVPVIVLSGVGRDGDLEQAIELGAAAYFVKGSMSLQELVRRVDDLLGAAAA